MTRKRQQRENRIQKGPLEHQLRQFPEKVYRAWMFSSADNDGDWAWKKISNLKEVHKKIANFEKMSDSEIRKSSHPIPLQRLCSNAQARLKEMKGEEWYEDSDRIFSYHINGKKRLWCLKDIDFKNSQVVYQILWWDPRHEVCPSPLRNT